MEQILYRTFYGKNGKLQYRRVEQYEKTEPNKYPIIKEDKGPNWMYSKRFDYKGQAVNYMHKLMNNNNKVHFASVSGVFGSSVYELTWFIAKGVK